MAHPAYSSVDHPKASNAYLIGFGKGAQPCLEEAANGFSPPAIAIEVRLDEPSTVAEDRVLLFPDAKGGSVVVTKGCKAQAISWSSPDGPWWWRPLKTQAMERFSLHCSNI